METDQVLNCWVLHLSQMFWSHIRVGIHLNNLLSPNQEDEFLLGKDHSANSAIHKLQILSNKHVQPFLHTPYKNMHSLLTLNFHVILKMFRIVYSGSHIP